MSSAYAAMPLWVVLSSLIAAGLILALGEPFRRTRTAINLAAAVVKLVLVGVMLWGIGEGHEFRFTAAVAPGITFDLHADSLAMLLSMLSAILWLVTTVYAIGYLEDSHDRARFFGFFSLCVTATMGVATAGNLFTFFLFYELLSLSTWPLVVHDGTRRAMRAGAVYLAFTLGGGAVLLLGVVLVQAIAGDTAFVPGGILAATGAPPSLLVVVFLLLFLGTAVKAAMVPLHIWLPRAMVAPAPVSALLHAVAVVKAGAFGIVRIVYDVFGLKLTALLGMNHLVVAAAAITIVYGSLQALKQSEVKGLLAYSTVSQVAYIALGVGLGSPLASIGGLAHLVHQGLMKITLFFCAGNFAHVHGVSRIVQMDGMGRRMPWTMGAFTLGALGMIGVPPVAGFIGKWYLGIGGIQDGRYWIVALLVVSTLLNAAYFLPLIGRGWFRPVPEGQPAAAFREAPASLLVPTLVAAGLALGAGFLAGMPYSPLAWTRFITEQVYG